MGDRKQGARSRPTEGDTAIPGGFPDPVADNQVLPRWGAGSGGSGSDAGAVYVSAADVMQLRTLDRGAAGSADLDLFTQDSALGPPGFARLRTGIGGGAARPRTNIGGPRLAVADVLEFERMPEILMRATGMRFDGVDIAENRQVVTTEHALVPTIGVAAEAYPQDPQWELQGQGAGTAVHSGIGLTVGTGANVNDQAILRPQPIGTTLFNDFIAIRALNCLWKRAIHIGATLVDYRIEAGWRDDPVTNFGADNRGAGAQAFFLRIDDTGAIPANWATVSDDGVGSVVTDTGFAAVVNTTVVLAIFTDGDDNIFYFIDEQLVVTRSIAAAPANLGTTYAGCEALGAAAARSVSTLGHAISRDNV